MTPRLATSSRVPAPLRPNDPVRVVAPAGRVEPESIERGLSWLGTQFELIDTPAPTGFGFLSGDTAERLAGLQSALDCPRTRAIFCARGGVGSTELLPHLDWRNFLRRPKWLVGFSDITALHLTINLLGISSIHGPNVTSLYPENTPKMADPRQGSSDGSVARASLIDRLFYPARSTALAATQLRPGKAVGTLLGGNLSLVHDALASGRLDPQDIKAPIILFLEEVAEPPYRLYRMLTALEHSGLIDRTVGMLIGHLTACTPGRYETTARSVFERFAKRNRLPTLWGLPAGHDSDNQSLTLGSLCRIQQGECKFCIDQ